MSNEIQVTKRTHTYVIRSTTGHLVFDTDPEVPVIYRTKREASADLKTWAVRPEDYTVEKQ